jgi:importin-7
MAAANHDSTLDREEALKDDFQLDVNSYEYDDEEEWNDDEATWAAGETEEQEEVADIKDESTAYLEFLNEEVRFQAPVPRTRHELVYGI